MTGGSRLTRRQFLAAAVAAPLDRAWRQAGFEAENIRLLLEGPEAAHAVPAWPEADEPIPPGSLLKPFAALAYSAGRASEYPTAQCTGEGCWLPSGHGKLGLEDALAQSCNVYFRALARAIDPSSMARTAVIYGLPAPPADADADSFWGLGDHWRIPPRRLLHAYRELHRRAADPGAGPVLEGLRRSASSGTAAGVGAPALAKTGTSPCVHRGSNGDGYVCLLYPSNSPRYTMLLQLHGRTGREAARAAGVVLTTLVRGMR